MRRLLFNAFALLSLLLYLLTLAAFVRSVFRSDQYTWAKQEDAPPSLYNWYLVLMSGRGGVALAHDAEVRDLGAALRWRAHPRYGPSDGWQYEGHSVGPPRYPRPAFNTRERAVFGFWLKWQHTPDMVRREIIVPYWFLALLTAAPPTLWLVVRRRERTRRRRRLAGQCTRCGYDLRASPGRCPECGAGAGTNRSA